LIETGASRCEDDIMAVDEGHDEQRHRQWEQRIADWRASGTSLLAYSRERGLCYSTLVRWRRRLQASRAATSTLTLIPVAAPTQRCPIVIRLPSGVGVEVTGGFDAALLQAVVHALQA
jgi:hypothetical protein